MMDLAVEKREKFGKDVKVLREQGLIPAELYGRGVENLHLSVKAKEFGKLFKEAGENTVINAVLGNEKRPVLINDVAVDPVSDKVLNVDLYQVRLDEKLKVKVPLEFVGESPGAKEKGGILVRAMQEVEVEALPTSIPHSFKVDISGLADIGNSIHASDLKVGSDVKLLVDPNATLITVTAQMTEEEEAKLSEEVKVDEIKSEGEEKKAERDAAKAADAPAEGANKEEAKPADKK